MNKENIKKSKFLSKILRHNPESAGITLDKHGWANVKDILHKCSLKMPINLRKMADKYLL